MRQRIPFDAVRSALQNQELRLEALEVLDDLWPQVREDGIVRAWRQRQIELGALGSSATCLLRRPGPRVKIAAVLMEVGEYDRGVTFEGVKDTIAMMCVDVDVGHPLQPELAAQKLDGDSAIVEYAKARGVVARGMMEPRDRHECVTEVACHDALGRRQGRSHHTGCGLVHAAKGRRIPAVEIALPACGALPHEFEIGGRVERQQLLVAGIARLEHAHLAIERARPKLAQERSMTVGTERVAVTEAVACETLAGDHHDVVAHRGAPKVRGCKPNTGRKPTCPRGAKSMIILARCLIEARQEMAQYIFTMQGVGKVVPPKRVIL